MSSALALLNPFAWWWDSVQPDARSLAVIAVNAVVVYLAALLVVRLGKKRMFGENTMFDVILGFVLGSTFARAINGDAPLVASVAAGAVLVGVHALFGYLSYHWHGIGLLVKGSADDIVRDGKARKDALRHHFLSDRDLDEAMHVQGIEPDVRLIKWARIERSGEISIIPYPPAPRVVDIDVQDGVQRVRLEIVPAPD